MAPLPATMKAVSFAKTGGVDVLDYKDHPVPRISATQLLVRNAYAGVNFIDTYFRSGQYPPPSSLPLILGQDGVGTVVAVGADVDVKTAAIGTQVVYMAGAAYAEYTAVEASRAVALPAGLDAATALAVFLQGLTAWTCVRRAAAVVRPDDWALVHAAAGGVGSLLVQMLGRGVVGARVIAAAGEEGKRRVVREELGAEHVVDGRDLEGMRAEVRRLTGGRGVDCIFDGVGKDTFAADLDMIAVGGSLVMIGSSISINNNRTTKSGNVDPIEIRSTLGPKNIRLARPVVYGYVAERADLEAWSAELFDLVRSGKVKPLRHGTYDLKDAAKAHTDIASRSTIGKLLIKIN